MISNFEQVEVLSGHVTLNGANTSAGTTTVGDGVFASVLTINGHHTSGLAYDVTAGSTLGGTGTLNRANPGTLFLDPRGRLQLNLTHLPQPGSAFVLVDLANARA